MNSNDLDEVEIAWELMTPMESALWATALALHASDADGGLAAADGLVIKLRDLAEVRSRRPEPEYEAAALNVFVNEDEFTTWYKVAYRIRHLRDPSYGEPGPQQISEAYERYSLSRNDFY